MFERHHSTVHSTPLLPNILVALDVNLMKHRVLGFPRNVRLHLHGDVAGEDRQEQPLLLLVLLLGGQPRLDALPRLHEGLSLGHLAGVVGQHARYVGAEEEHGIAAHLNYRMVRSLSSYRVHLTRVLLTFK